MIHEIPDSVQVPTLDSVLQGPHVVVGILEVYVCSVFLHQSLNNAVIAIEGCYLHGAEPVLGDEVGLDVLIQYCYSEPHRLVTLTPVSMRTVTISTQPC